MMQIDGEQHVLGRLASAVAQRLKDGENVNIFNADKVIVRGNPDSIMEEYRDRYEMGSRDHGPHFPKAPERIVKRTVRGMLPGGSDGREMLKRLKTYRGEPEDDAEIIDDARVEELRGSNYLTIGEISERLGA